MPVSVIVGGQFGSEGKGKVALAWVRRDPSTTIVIRPGGTNSGHTAYAKDGQRIVLRQLPVGAIDGNVRVVLPAGSYIDVELLEREIAQTGIPRSQIIVDPRAHVIRRDHVDWEHKARLVENIGSTGSGTGAAVLSRLARFAPGLPPSTAAAETPELIEFVAETTPIVDEAVRNGERVVIEGTQGFGLSPLHGDSWPKCTSRDTTASAFLSEAGLSPRHVDEIVLVIRCHPIRVAGDSGPLTNETTWEAIAAEAGAPNSIQEFTSVTAKLRRVGRFDADLVRRSVTMNYPTQIVLNHLDYVDWCIGSRSGNDTPITAKAEAFIRKVETGIGRNVDFVGLGPDSLLPRVEVRVDLADASDV